MGAEAPMQDQAAAHTADRTALSDNCTRRELAPNTPDKELHREVGDKEMGRSAGGFRKKRIACSNMTLHELGILSYSAVCVC